MKDMKNVTLIGASGFVGTALLNELLARGHKVTAVVRNLDKIGVSNPNLAVVKLMADELETPKHHYERFTIGY